jgi:hypothetical protein
MKHFRQHLRSPGVKEHFSCRSSNMDTVGKWRWVREEASLLDGDLLLCFNGVVSVAAVIRRCLGGALALWPV